MPARECSGRQADALSDAEQLCALIGVGEDLQALDLIAFPAPDVHDR